VAARLPPALERLPLPPSAGKHCFSHHPLLQQLLLLLFCIQAGHCAGFF
jgi:hypothetical protein